MTQNIENWFGRYLDFDGIVADILQRLESSDETYGRTAKALWLDPASWTSPASVADAAKGTGCLMLAEVYISNHYGLWHKENPYFSHLDPAVSARAIIEQVKAKLRQ